MGWSKFEPLDNPDGTPNEKAKNWRRPKMCRHPEHKPPGMIVLKPGHYVWKCPACGQASPINVPEGTTLAVRPVRGVLQDWASR